MSLRNGAPAGLRIVAAPKPGGGRSDDPVMSLRSSELQALIQQAVSKGLAEAVADLRRDSFETIELGPPLGSDWEAEYTGDTSSDGYSAAFERWPESAEIDQAIERQALRYGQVCPLELAQRLGSVDVEGLAVAILGRLQDAGYEGAAEYIDDSKELAGLQWQPADPAALADLISDLGELADDCSAEWRYLIGHCLYIRAFKSRGLSYARRYFGRYLEPPISAAGRRQAFRIERGPTAATLERYAKAARAEGTTDANV